MSDKPKRKGAAHTWRRVIVGVTLFLVVLALLVTAAFHSESVFRQLASFAKPLVPGELQYEKISGTLAGPVVFTGLDYEIAGTNISAEHLGFDIAPLALLGGNVSLRNVQARELVIQLAESEQEPQTAEPAKPADILDALQLPVAINADNIVVDGFTLRSAQGESLLQLDRFSASLAWNEKRIELGSLQADGLLLTADGTVRLGLAENADTDLQLDVTWRGLEFPLSGELQAHGTAAELRLNASLREPAQATLDATVGELLGTPRWQGALQVEQLQPSTIGNDLPSTAWAGTVDFHGSRENTNVQARLSGGWPPATGISLNITADVNTRRALVQQLEAQVNAFDAKISAQGELHYAEGLRYSAAGNISRFNWPDIENLGVRDAQFDVSGNAQQLQGTLAATADGKARGQLSLDGSVQFDNLNFDGEVSAENFQLAFDETQIHIAELDGKASGTPQNYSADAEARIRVNQLPTARLAAHVEGSTDQLSAQLQQLQWLNGSAQGNVQLAWQDALQLSVDLQGKGFQLSQLDAQLNGTLGGDISATANFAGEQPEVQATINSLSGSIAGTEVGGGGSIHLADGQLSTRGLDITAGGGKLHLEGTEGSGFDFFLQAPELDRFHPELSGSIRATGHFEGDLQSPTFDVRAAGNDVGWQEWQAGSFELDGELGQGGKQKLSVDVKAQQLQTPATAAKSARINIDGSLASHSINVSLQGAGEDAAGNLTLAAKGGVEDQQWQGSIGELQFDHPATGTWRLPEERSKQITLGADEIDVPTLRLDGPQGNASLGPFNMHGGEWQAQSQLQEIPIAIIAGLLPQGLDYAGTVSGQFNVSSGKNGLEGRAGFNLSEGGIRQLVGEGSETLLGWQSGSATVNFDGRVARGKLNIDLDGGDRITGSGHLNVPADGAMQIDTSLQASIENLQLIPSLIPELSRLRGRVTANLDVNGPLSKPRIRGKAQLHDASARILALGTTWENVNLTLTGEGRAINVTGRAESGEGHIEITVDARDTGEKLLGKAKLTGEAFKVINTPEADVNISPELQLELQGNDLFIDGNVFVPFARIEPRDLAAAVQPSPDQVIVNNQQQAASEDMRIHVAVTTRLGEDVRVAAFGLKARLEGKLTVTQEPQGRPIGNGRLTIMEGEYKAYGQDLTLAKGEIIYTGQPLSNPGLDIRAERTIDPDVTAGVAVRGPLSNPTANVYSDPVMPETEALSYLLFGRPIEQITGGQQGQVSNAAIALNLGGQKLLGKVGRQLGVEEIRVDQVGNPERASLVLGKYLSPDLYVSYGIGLFEAVNTFRVRYRISSKWTLEAVSGLKSSADVLYTIER